MGEETRAAVRAVETLERKDRILIVEDEDNARKGYEQLLQRWGYDVLGVGSAEEVLAKFAEPTPRTSRSEEHTSELQSLRHLVCRLLLEKKKRIKKSTRRCY